MLFQEPAPVFINQKGVGLQVVPALLSFRQVLFFKLHDFFIEIQTRKGGFAAVPGKGNNLAAALCNIVTDIRFKERIAHADIGKILTVVCVKIVTVFTAHVAERADWFCHCYKGNCFTHKRSSVQSVISVCGRRNPAFC